jgi:transposase
MVQIIEDLVGDWRQLDERIEALSGEIEALARWDAGSERLMSAPGIGPIISSAMVAAIGTGDTFTKGRDFAACARSSARYRAGARRGWRAPAPRRLPARCAPDSRARAYAVCSRPRATSP